MRRLALLGALLAGSLLSAQSAVAAGARPHASNRISAPGKHYAAESLAPALQTISSASQLRLSTNIFSGNTTVQANQPVNSSSADQTFPFGTLVHAATAIPYRNSGMLGGWYALAQANFTGNAYGFESYLASYYQNTDQTNTTIANIGSALGYFTQFFSGSTSCTFGKQCLQAQFQLSDTNGNIYQGVYRVVQAGNAIFEVEFDFDPADFSGNQAAGMNYLDTATNAFLAALNPTPTPPPSTPPPSTPPPSTPPPSTPPPTTQPTSTSFSITGVRVEKNKSQSDPQFQHAPLAKVKTGTTVYLSIYVNVNSAPANSNLQAEWIVKAGTKVLLDHPQTFNLGSNPAGVYRFYLPVKLSGRGLYEFQGKIAINGQTQTSLTTIQITKKKKKK